MKDKEQIEKNLQRRLREFTNPESKVKPPSPNETAKQGLTAKLAVRKKRISLDTLFVYESDSISELQARIEAERQAKKEGWKIIGYLVSIERREK